MSGVKVTNERPARAIPDSESVDGTVVDEDVDWEPDTTTGIPPGTDPGDVLTWDGDSWEPEPPTSSGDFELNIEGGQSVISAHGSAGSTETIDPTDGNVHTLTLNAACTFTLNSPAGSGAALLELWITQDGTGGWAITWPGSVTLQGTLDTTAGTTSRVLLDTVDGGTNWIATVVGSSSSALTVKDEGSSLDTAVTSIDFTGAGVTATNVGHAVTVDVPAPVVGQYRAWLFSASGGTLTILTATDGTPLVGLFDLE